MGRLRWISKPFKRWAFAKGKYFTNLYAWRYQRKYTAKFLRQQAKISTLGGMVHCTNDGRSDFLAQRIADVLTPVKEGPGSGKPLVVLTQGDPLEPSGISAITPLVAKQLNAPRALVYLDQEIAHYHWRDADRRDMALEIKYSLLVAEINKRIPGSMAAIMDAIDQQLAEKNTERLMLKKTPLKDYYRDFALLQEVTKVASFQLSGELTMIHTSPRISPDSVTSFCRVGFTLGLVDQSDRVAYGDSDPAE